MFERSFQWVMKYGARILFAIALVYLALGLVHAVMSAVEFGRGASPFAKSSWMLFVLGLSSTMAGFGFLLFGAIAIDCINRWLIGKPPH